MLSNYQIADDWKLGLGPDLAWIYATSKSRRHKRNAKRRENGQ